MRARPLLLGLLWVGVTAALTATAWLAVQLVATQVGGDTTTVLSAEAVQAAAAGASSSPSVTPSPSSSADPGPSSSASGSPRPSSSPKPSSSAGGSTTHNRTFAVTGGTVAASCTGATAALRSAQPRDGWSVEVKDRGPDRVRVEFRTSTSKTEVEVRCSGGLPTATTEQDDHGGGGGGGDDGGHGGGDDGSSGPG